MCKEPVAEDSAHTAGPGKLNWGGAGNQPVDWLSEEQEWPSRLLLENCHHHFCLAVNSQLNTDMKGKRSLLVQ